MNSEGIKFQSSCNYQRKNLPKTWETSLTMPPIFCALNCQYGFPPNDTRLTWNKKESSEWNWRLSGNVIWRPVFISIMLTLPGRMAAAGRGYRAFSIKFKSVFNPLHLISPCYQSRVKAENMLKRWQSFLFAYIYYFPSKSRVNSDFIF